MNTQPIAPETANERFANYIGENKSRFLDELFDLLRIPSVSTDKAFNEDVKKAAHFVCDRLKEAGVDTAEVVRTSGHPIVFAEKHVSDDAPTVLVYGHYDVQPADPLHLWKTDAFSPEIRDGSIYARGASDDKGQMYMHVKAFETLVKNDALTCNVKFMIEGEEESGSTSLPSFLKEYRDKLSADVILVSDTSILGLETPSITVGLRGLSYVEVEVTGPNRDLHSGLYGGAVANPINVLCEMVASLKDAEGRITVPGFYDKVVELSAEERAAMAEAPFSLDRFKDSLGIRDVRGEAGYSTPERTSIRPTLDVNGIWGGYMGEGAKTVIASKAYAKISMRLVPDQDWHEVTDLFVKHFESIAPDSVSVKVTPHHGGMPGVTPTDSAAFRAGSKAMELTMGKAPIPHRGGGSIPIVPMFKSELGLDTLLMGFGLDSDAIHSPNEKFGVDNFVKGIETICLFYGFFAEEAK